MMVIWTKSIIIGSYICPKFYRCFFYKREYNECLSNEHPKTVQIWGL